MHEQQTDATNEIMEPGGPGSQLAQAEALFRPPLHEVHVSHPLSQAASECQMDEDQTDETATDFTDLSLLLLSVGFTRHGSEPVVLLIAS